MSERAMVRRRRVEPRSPASNAAAAAAPHLAALSPRNLAVLHALGVRAKLTVSQPGDAEEREADRAAEEFAAGRKVFRACGCGCGGSGSCSNDGTVYRSARTDVPRTLSLPARGLLTGSGGSALPAGSRQRYERFFGADLSAVRVHSDGGVARIVDRLGARALTAGSDIAFARGQFAPGTAEGDRLLAHELTHVVQSGGGARHVRAAGADVQADGGLTDRDMEMIRQWLQSEGQPATGFEPMRALDAPPRPFSFGAARSVGDPLQGQAVSDVCPSCHQRPDEQRAERARRQAEDAARRRRESWHRMHGAQAEGDLAGQAATLTEDVDTSTLALGQQRLRMFDAALRDQPAGAAAAAGRAAITQEMRDALEQAQGTVMVLEGLLRAADAEIPAEIVTPMRLVLARYYQSLADFFARRDREVAEAEERMRHQMPTVCPSCHDRPRDPSIHTPFDVRGFGGPQAQPEPTIPSFLQRSREPEPLPAPLVRTGPRATRIDAAIRRNDAADTRANWREVVADYRWSVDELDGELRTRLWSSSAGREMVEQFEFTQGLLQRQQQLLDQYPEALKVQAVFYPKEDVVDETDQETGRTRAAARAIPWHFYLTRPPAPADPRYVPAGYEWQLHDITAPRRDNRTVRKRYQIGMFEALARERGPWRDPHPIHQMDPPPSLFEELNHHDFFPEGELYFNYPVAAQRGEVQRGHVTMTDDTPFGVWLERIGMALALVGGLVFAPFSVPMLLAVGAGTALSIAGRVHRRAEMEEHGIWSAADSRQFYWELSLDLVNALTLGLGRVATVTARAGSLLRAAQATRFYFMARRAEIAMQGANLFIVTADIVQQYRAIQASSMSEQQKADAMRGLAFSALLTGGLSLVMLRSALHDLGPNARLRIDLDPANPGRLVADIEPGLDAASRSGGRTRPDATQVNRITITHALTGESHALTIWSDGRFTRCSPPPCMLLAESCVTRLDELADTMLSVSRHQPTMQDLRTRASQLQQDAEAFGTQPVATQRTLHAALMARGRALELETGRLESLVVLENDAATAVGRQEAQARYGDAALNYDRRYYRWLWDRDTGRLVFQRRNQAVPWMRFEDGQFVVSRTLFVPVSAERLAEVRAGSVTNQPDFRIVGTPITSVAELRRLRPYSITRQPRPTDWVLVQINDQNLVQFYSEPVPHGAIFEFPDGSRLWRTPQNTIATDGPIRSAIGRRGFEASVPPQLRGTGEDSNLGVDIRGAAGDVEHQRSHPRGSGTGFELFNHIPLAPTYVNQVLQNRGIELYISELHRLNPTLDLRFHTEHALFPTTRRQAWIDYHVYLVRNGRPERMFTVRIGTDYSDPLRPAEVEFRNFSQRPDHLAILDTPDMRAARAALDARIREARARRGP